ncbi:MAG: enoyl-CoA hydratase [Flavobacteriaceae bacterium]|nr:enoyl-CoA hydratase [Flavobacteriaceae bacterium]|tara:strand:+ start:37427 stop:38209 length:783 start_codon:yes stop_codon:yes gene_type:complete
MGKVVLYNTTEGVAIITLNRPERYNAVNQGLIDGINESLDKASEDKHVRAIVITGAGKGFCAGADMSVFGTNVTPEQRRDYLINQYRPLINKFYSLKKPIIGAINGTAAGVGAAIALACDLRIMSENSSLLFAFINIGLGPDGGASWLLSRQVGYSKAFEIAISGKKILGNECKELGLTNRVVQDQNIVDEAISWAKELVQKPTLAIGITKQDMFYSMTNDLNETIAFEAKCQVAAFNSYDLKEGVTAFIEKRKPKFKGK